MKLSIDLHSHSGASGGVGKVSLPGIAATMRKKGIAVFGTGDALHDGWLNHLEQALRPAEAGLYRLVGADNAARFLVQTEIIITSPVPSGGRKGVHTVLLLPSLEAAREACRLFDRWEVKRNIGRPFLVCEDSEIVGERLHAIRQINESIEIIPAHVLTPQGIFGSDHPVDSLHDFFGEAAEHIRVVETGLSADPLVLGLIPELDGRTLISSSDCHSGALNRVGREYTTVEVSAPSYAEIITALREGRIINTAEFTPAEGRYFLTGHRAGKKGHRDGEYCYFSPDTTPPGNLCPVCGKPLTVGVLARALELSTLQGQPRTLEMVKPKQPFIHMIPLVEVLAAAVGVKNSASRKVVALYDRLIKVVGNETAFWAMPETDALRAVETLGEAAIVTAVRQVRAGEYSFRPLGYDGTYGSLALGEKQGWFGHREIFTKDQERQG